MPFDTVKDFAADLASRNRALYFSGSPIDAPSRSVKELLALARARPGEIDYASGEGGSPHLATELFKSMANVDLHHIPFKGAGPARLMLSDMCPL
ncbi:MAG: hypothetical protein KIT18_04840 [Burkholderiales bacterium]|nr:hypothetical protein [Burkholderiales bacterium]